MNIGSRSDEPASRDDQKYFDRLERSVEFLIQEHQRLNGERDELLEELVEREQRIATLESRLVAEEGKCASAAESVDKILGRLDQLRSSVTAKAEAL